MTIVGAWLVWLAIAIVSGIWLARVLLTRWLALIFVPFIFLLPAADVIFAYWVGPPWVKEVGARVVNEVVTVPGLLYLSDTNSPTADIESFLGGDRPYEYLELRYTSAVRTRRDPQVELGPGFLQFRLVDPSSPACQTTNGDLHREVWAISTTRCVRITRTEQPISRYSWEYGVELQSPPLARLLNIGARCAYAREVSSGRVLAQDCDFRQHSALGVWTPDWGAPTRESPDYNVLRLDSVLVPPAQSVVSGEIESKGKNPERNRFSTAPARVTLGGLRFSVPVNEVGGEIPTYQWDVTSILPLLLFLDDGKLRGIRPEPPDDPQDAIVVYMSTGNADWVPPPDYRLNSIVRGGGRTWSGPEFNPELQLTQFTLQKHAAVRAYAMLASEDREPDGTMLATECQRATCRVFYVRFNPQLTYRYEFPATKIGLWRTIHAAIRLHLENLQEVSAEGRSDDVSTSAARLQ